MLKATKRHSLIFACPGLSKRRYEDLYNFSHPPLSCRQSNLRLIGPSLTRAVAFRARTPFPQEYLCPGAPFQRSWSRMSVRLTAKQKSI